MNGIAVDIQVERANLKSRGQRQRIVSLVDMFSRSPTGRGRRMTAVEREGLDRMLQEAWGVRVFYAIVDAPEPELDDAALAPDGWAGIAVCSLQPKTFSGSYKLNVHDLAVVEPYRGHGVGRRLLGEIIGWAACESCHSVTLEVLTENPAARALYRSLGFGPTHPVVEEYWVRPCVEADVPSDDYRVGEHQTPPYASEHR